MEYWFWGTVRYLVKGCELPEVHGVDMGPVVDEQLRHLKVAVGAGVVQGHQTTLVLRLHKGNILTKTIGHEYRVADPER